MSTRGPFSPASWHSITGLESMRSQTGGHSSCPGSDVGLGPVCSVTNAHAQVHPGAQDACRMLGQVGRNSLVFPMRGWILYCGWLGPLSTQRVKEKGLPTCGTYLRGEVEWRTLLIPHEGCGIPTRLHSSSLRPAQPRTGRPQDAEPGGRNPFATCFVSILRPSWLPFIAECGSAACGAGISSLWLLSLHLKISSEGWSAATAPPGAPSKPSESPAAASPKAAEAAPVVTPLMAKDLSLHRIPCGTSLPSSLFLLQGRLGGFLGSSSLERGRMRAQDNSSCLCCWSPQRMPLLPATPDPASAS